MNRQNIFAWFIISSLQIGDFTFNIKKYLMIKDQCGLNKSLGAGVPMANSAHCMQSFLYILSSLVEFIGSCVSKKPLKKRH